MDAAVDGSIAGVDVDARDDVRIINRCAATLNNNEQGPELNPPSQRRKMDRADTKPGILDGASVGTLLTAPLVAVSYLAWKLAGLPFAPFGVFDWIARALPGSIVTFSIHSLVNFSRVLQVSSTG